MSKPCGAKIVVLRTFTSWRKAGFEPKCSGVTDVSLAAYQVVAWITVVLDGLSVSQFGNIFRVPASFADVLVGKQAQPFWKNR